MIRFKLLPILALALLAVSVTCCKAPEMAQGKTQVALPESFAQSKDTANSAKTTWRQFFKDPYLSDLIDIALQNNQELLITQQEIEISKNDIRIRKGAILPTVGVKAGAGLDKVGRYTSQGAGDASTEIKPGEEMPDPLTDYNLSLYAHWEVDIWKKLRNSKKAAVSRYLASVEGKNFMLTNLVAEIADSYYELTALDSQLEIVRQNIALQQKALDIVKIQKEGARATELAVQKFQAEVLSSQNLEFGILQRTREAENRINFLLGRYPQQIKREKTAFLNWPAASIQSGIPSQLLANRPDIKQAELELAAAKLDVKAARAEFYPSLDINAAIGLQAFKPSYLLTLPESLVYSLAGDLVAPLINRNAIKAEFKNANARQLQALYNYERTILNAYVEVSNGLSRINNLQSSFSLQTRQVEALNKSIGISNDLFQSARVDYFEVLMTQRDALESQLELVETKKDQLTAAVHLYRNLGGGWN